MRVAPSLRLVEYHAVSNTDNGIQHAKDDGLFEDQLVHTASPSQQKSSKPTERSSVNVELVGDRHVLKRSTKKEAKDTTRVCFGGQNELSLHRGHPLSRGDECIKVPEFRTSTEGLSQAAVERPRALSQRVTIKATKEGKNGYSRLLVEPIKYCRLCRK